MRSQRSYRKNRSVASRKPVEMSIWTRCEHTAQNGDLVHVSVACSLSETLQEIRIFNENAGEKVLH